MAGQLTPAVFLPRFTTLSGRPTSGDVFLSTVPMDVTPFQSGLINVWRGSLIGTTPSVKINFQESSDGVKWGNCTGYSVDADPGNGVEVQYTPTLKKKWFRVTVELAVSDNIVTLWAAGFLEERES
jgi:hypothetical protein